MSYESASSGEPRPAAKVCEVCIFRLIPRPRGRKRLRVNIQKKVMSEAEGEGDRTSRYLVLLTWST
jgi:hypothetical protein